MHEFKVIEVKKKFDRKLKLDCPFFESVKSKDIPRGSKLYIWSTNGLSCFLLLKVFSETRYFSFEVFWSKFNELPNDLIAIMAPYDNEGNITFSKDQNVFASTIERLWGAKRSYEWKLLEKESEVCLYSSKQINGEGFYSCDLDELIEDATNKINTFVVPYFREVQSRNEGTE